jgi:light-regulated signal transduction histidine kinase (bacteriophytochrome)
MMSNLINNGVDAVEEKGGKGIVEVAYEVKGEEVEVIVKDNGVGMPKEKVEKINMYDKHILVTNEYLAYIKNFNDKIYFFKMLNKMFLNEIPFEII